MSGWIWLPIGGLLAATIVVAALLARRSRRAVSVELVPYVVDFVHFWGVLAIAVASVASVWQAVTTMLPGTAVSVRTPLAFFWPELHDGVELTDGPIARVVSGGITEADLGIADLTAGTRALLAGGSLLQGAVFVIVALAIVQLCRALRRREPFGAVVTRSGRIAALSVGLGGLAAQVLLELGRSRASFEALEVTGWISTNPEALDPSDARDTGLVRPAFELFVEFTPIAVALAIWVVTELIAAGARMQAENARLRADTDGLV